MSLKMYWVFPRPFFPGLIFFSRYCLFIVLFHISYFCWWCSLGCHKLFMCFFCTLRCYCVPPFIPFYPFLHHPPFSLMGRVALTLFHLRIPHSVNPSSFTPWLQDSLWYLFRLLSPIHIHSLSLPSVPHFLSGHSPRLT